MIASGSSEQLRVEEDKAESLMLFIGKRGGGDFNTFEMTETRTGDLIG